MISLSLFILKIGCSQQSVDLHLLQIGERILPGAFEGNTANFSALGQVLGTAFADEARQRMDRRQPLVARGDSAAVFLLDRPKEGTYRIGGQVFDRQRIDRSMRLRHKSWQEKPQHVAIAALCVSREITFGNQILHQKTPDPGTEQRTYDGSREDAADSKNHPCV